MTFPSARINQLLKVSSSSRLKMLELHDQLMLRDEEVVIINLSRNSRKMSHLEKSRKKVSVNSFEMSIYSDIIQKDIGCLW